VERLAGLDPGAARHRAGIERLAPSRPSLTSEEEEVTDIEADDDFCVASVEDGATT
jgi:hypothetical protein